MATTTTTTTTIFSYIFSSYTVLTFHRRALSFVSHILRDSKLLTTQQLGAAASLNAFVFAVTKFATWTFVNRIGAKSLLVFSLIFASLTAFLMTVCPSFILFSIVWALAGLAHGTSWPPCGFFVKNLSTAENFGRWWGIVSSSSNVSALCGPVLTWLFLSSLGFGWQSIYILTGFACFFLAIVVAKVLPDVRKFKEKDEESPKSPSEVDDKSSQHSWTSLFGNKAFMFLCLAYITLSTVKFSFANWIQLCLIDSNIQLSFVVYYVTFMELGGLFGSLSSGFVASRISKFFSIKGKDKIAILLIYNIGILMTLYWLFILINLAESPLFAIWWNALIIGSLIASMYSLFGMVPMEIVGSQSAGRYSSVIDLAGSIGSLLAGYPISLLQSVYGWSGVILALELTMAFAFIALWLAFTNLHIKRDEKIR